MKQIEPVSLIVLPLVAHGQTIEGDEPGHHHQRETLHRGRPDGRTRAFAPRGSRTRQRAAVPDLEESSRMKDEFLGIVSHELHAP